MAATKGFRSVEISGPAQSQMLCHLVQVAQSRQVRWVGLETGTMEEFASARRLYESFGFSECPPFGDYGDNPFSGCMSLAVTR